MSLQSSSSYVQDSTSKCELTEFDSGFWTDISPSNPNSWMGLEFASCAHALDFYKQFAHRRGFSVRILQQVKRNSKNKQFDEPFYLYYCCNKEGFKDGAKVDISSSSLPEKRKRMSKKKKDSEFKAESAPPPKPRIRRNKEERSGCGAMIKLQYVEDRGHYHIVSWIDEHNHDLFPRELTHMIKSNREISEVQAQVALTHMSCGMTGKQSFQLMTQTAGGKGNVGYLKSDLKNWIRTHRQDKMKDGELNVLLKFLSDQSKKKPSFYYDIQLDENDLITNIFWSDGEMQHDYECFGDFLSLDTTFRTNNTYRPLAPFLGFSHHRQSCMFGCALLFDQKTDTFVWLLQTFLKCMNGKRPVSIFTDQDAAIGNAIAITLPDVFHGLCTWHIWKNAVSNLGSLCTPEVNRDFQYLINNVDDEKEFEDNWKLMVDENFGGVAHNWLSFIYISRMHWSSAWVKNHFTAGSKTTQLSESFNAFLRDYHSIDHNLVEFFHHFNLVLDDMREKLNKSVYDSIRYLPDIRYPHSPFINQVSSCYTPAIFKLFQDEYSLTPLYYGGLDQKSDVLLRKVLTVFRFHPTDVELKIDVRTVIIDLEFSEWVCSCRKFENWGVLCCHILKGVDILGSSRCFPQQRRISNKYILKRWSRSARGSLVSWAAPDVSRPLNYSSRYQEYCSTMIRMGNRVCMHEEVYIKFMKEVQDAFVRAEEEINSACPVPIVPEEVSGSIGSSRAMPSSSLQSVKGIKVKENPNKSRKRLKSARELVSQKLKSTRKTKKDEGGTKDV